MMTKRKITALMNDFESGVLSRRKFLKGAVTRGNVCHKKQSDWRHIL